MEDDVVLDQCVLELALFEKKVSVFSVCSFETSSIIVCFCDIQQFAVNSELGRNQFRNVLEEGFYIDLAHLLFGKSFIDLCEISSVDEYSY